MVGDNATAIAEAESARNANDELQRNTEWKMQHQQDSERKPVQEVTIESRCERFVDSSNEQLLKSGNLNELNCFYQGDLVHERMAAVRRSIYDIRFNWPKFDQFMSRLKQFMENESTTSGGLSDSVKKIFERRRNWADLESTNESFSSLEEEFNVLHTYTTKEGFKEIFKISDGIFRNDLSVNFEDMIINAVFLVELINIDLFNYVYKFPEHRNFSGVVYRGMAIPRDVFGTFESLLQQPINKRYISIPLGLWSASLLLPQAMSFIKDELKRQPERVPLVMKIHVLNVDEDYLKVYRKKFQERSVVSTICAVDITNVSAFKEEREVLLRGGFYQALNFYDEKIDGLDCKVLELVMLNTNRDHLSNPTLFVGNEESAARTLFGTMVGVTRNRFIVDYCQKHDLLDDLEKYQALLTEGQEKLKKLMG